MKLGDEIYVHGYVDEIRKNCIIVKNKGGYFGTVQEEISEALPPIDLREMDLWIPVSEGLPEMYERVLISVKEDGHNERIELAFLAQPAPRNIRFRAIPHWYEIDDVLAWMPLPKPYEVEEE